MKNKWSKISLLSASLFGLATPCVIALSSCSNSSADETSADVIYEALENDSGYKVTGIRNADKTKIKSIKIAKTYNNKPVLSIDEGALKGCSNLKTLTIPFIGADESATNEEGMLGYVFGSEMYEGCGGYTWQECYDQNNVLIYGQYAIPASLETVNVTNAKTIPAGAFSQCKNISKINITCNATSKVTEIGNKAFYYCSGLPNFNLSFSDQLKVIGKEAFANCFTLESIEIPSSVKTIKQSAFANCISSAKAIILKSIDSIEANAFSNHIGGLLLVEDDETTFFTKKNPNKDWSESSNVAVFECNSANSRINVDDWVIMVCGTENNKYGYLAQWMGEYKQQSVTIPSKVKYNGNDFPIKIVGGKLFYQNVYTTRVTIQEGIEYIYPNAFESCTSLKYVNFPSTLKEIKNDAFNGCSSLIGYYDAAGEIEVNTIDIKNVTKIGKRAFYGCKSITTLNLGNVESIDDEAFAHCARLNGTLTIPSTCTSLGEGAFKYCFKYAPSDFTGSIYYPTVIISEALTNIPESCFESCGVRNQTSPDLEDKGTYYPKRVRVSINLNGAPLTRIENAAFKNCWIYQLSGARKTKLEYIGDYSFYYAQPISDLEGEKTDLQIDYEVQYIGQYAFAYCTTIESLTFLTKKDDGTEMHKNSLKHLGQYAFYYINNSNFTELDLSPCLDLETSYEKSQADINQSSRYAFASCPYLEKVYLPGYDNYRAADEKKGYKTTYIDSEGQTKETTHALKFNEISERMFQGCTNLGKDTDRSTLVITDYTTTLRAYAFDGCTFLTKMLIKSKVDFMGSYLFRNCQYLQYIAKNYTDESTNDPVEFAPTLTRVRIGSYIYQNCYKLTFAPIPAGKVKEEVEEGKEYSTDTYFDINSSSFINCGSLKTITLPATVRTIGANCFQGCIGLETVNIANNIGSRLTTIDQYAFSECAKLEKLNLKGCTKYSSSYFYINASAFYYCTSLGKDDTVQEKGNDYKFFLPPVSIRMGNKPFEGWDATQTVYFSLANATYSGKGQTFTYPAEFTLTGTSGWVFERHGSDKSDYYYTVKGNLDGSNSKLKYKYEAIA